MGKSCVLETAQQLELDKMIIVKDLNIHVMTKYFKKCKDYTDLIKRMIEIMDVYKNIQTTQGCNLFANLVLDFEEINISNIDFEFMKHLIKYFEEKYENILNFIYCKNVTFIFKMCYKILKPFISSDIKLKLKFIKKGSTEILDSLPDNEFD